MSELVGGWYPFVILLVAGFLPNEVWRLLGLVIGGGIEESSEILVWVRAVATAILAGVIAQILIVPPDTPHKFTNLGPGALESTDIHENGAFITKWLE